MTIHWDELHLMARAGLSDSAGMTVGNWRWNDLDPWMQDILKDTLSRRSRGVVTLVAQPHPPTE